MNKTGTNSNTVPPPDVLVRNENPPALAKQGEVDKKEHYDLDGVSFENDVGVIVASDASKVAEEIQKE